MKPITAWALTNGKDISRDWEGVPILYKSKSDAVGFRVDDGMRPVKVIITEAPK